MSEIQPSTEVSLGERNGSQPNLILNDSQLTAEIEPFDSFWEGPEDVEKGYASFGQFYRVNYLGHVPANKQVRILVISCGPGYFVNLLNQEGYRHVTGIDSDPEKVKYAQDKGLDCRSARAISFLTQAKKPFDVIICEQELNHLTKKEMVMFLKLCRDKLNINGTLIVHGLNGANPLVGAETLAQNFDHFNTFTEYSLKQVLEHCRFDEIKIIPLNLYVFYNNPLNYVALLITSLYHLFFRLNFALYGKKNKTFTKKIGAACKKAS